VSSLVWDFGDTLWPIKFINKLYVDTDHKDEFSKRAEERLRFSKEEVEKLSDRNLEKIVSNYFSSTEVHDPEWIAMLTPASVALTPSSQSIACTEPTSVTTLFDLSPSTPLLKSAGLIFQEDEVRVSAKGEEKVVRKDRFRTDVNESMVLSEAGAALLRGLDLLSFKQDCLLQVKESKQALSIKDYWARHLASLGTAVLDFTSAVIETLSLQGSNLGLMPYRAEVTQETIVEVTDQPSDESNR
jgi:hypothetical protein